MKIFPVLVILFLFSCKSNDDTSSFILENPNKYNEIIEIAAKANEPWTKDPVSIVEKLFRYDDPIKKESIELERESTNNAIVVLTQEGLMDDSVYGEKRIIEFVKIANHWNIQEIRLGFKCHEGRGQSNYAGDLCS